MKMHRYEEIWLAYKFWNLDHIYVIIGYQTFALGMGPPSHKETIDPQKVDETAPFDNPGVFETGENEYEVVMTLKYLVLHQVILKFQLDQLFIYNDFKRRCSWIPSCWNKLKCNGHAWIYSKNHAKI